MSDLPKHSQRTSAARAGFSERTARRFDANPTLPSNRKIVHGRTVADPLEGYWEGNILPLLERDSALQACTRWPSPTIGSGAPWNGGCGSGGR
nr:hypothetical protein [Cereibacter changlensis]